MPWSHRLPDYVRAYPGYGQNLVAVVSAISELEQPSRFTVIDIGANVGDSALQVLNAVDVDVVCVEPDPYWLGFLQENSASEPRIRIVHAMLLPSLQEARGNFASHRADGTTRFVVGAGAGATPTTTTAESLRCALPELAPVRLVKTDTDGFDVRLLPDLARTFGDTRPVLFFEFDPPLARETGDENPEKIWTALSALGYEQCVVWNNFGTLLGSWPIADLARVAAIFEKSVEERGYHYWDVAALHRSDPHNAAIQRAVST